MNKLAPFAKLFKKYRLRSEFETLTEFGDALADYNLVFENSIFSHWQKGSRTPKDRHLLLTIIKMFCLRKGITSAREAHAFMASTGLGNLTEEEVVALPLSQAHRAPFQAPRKNPIFIGRHTILEQAHSTLEQHGVVIFSGASGTGKTAIATELAHTLQDSFTDGVIWCSVGTNDITKIHHEIAQSYGQTFPLQSNSQETSSLYKSLVSTKNALFIFDNVHPDKAIEALLPSASKSAVIITTPYSGTAFDYIGTHLYLEVFNHQELHELYHSLLDTDAASLTEFCKLAHRVGNVPMAVTLLAQQLKFNRYTVKELTDRIDQSSDLFSRLYTSFSMCIQALPPKAHALLKTCAVFNGLTFSHANLAAVSGYSETSLSKYLLILTQYSFIKEVATKRYQLHPMLQRYLSPKKISKQSLLRLIQYYISFIQTWQQRSEYFKKMAPEVDLILYSLKLGLDNTIVDETCQLWQLFGSYYWHVGAWKHFQQLSLQVYELAKQHDKKELLLSICLEEVSRLYYYDGDIKKACSLALDALELARDIQSPFWQALANQRYGKLCFMNKEIEKGYTLLEKAGDQFQTLKNEEYLSHNYRYLSEGLLLEKKFDMADEYLARAHALIQEVPNKTRVGIYASVIYSHRGMIAYLQGDFKKAKKLFEKGLETNEEQPLVRGTYTWLNKMGLALTYHKLNYEYEAKELLYTARQEMKHLGIESSYHVINAYAAALSPALNKLV